jgi:hypothetical protein
MPLYVTEYDESRSPANDRQFWGRRVVAIRLAPLGAEDDDVFGVLVAPCKIEIMAIAVVDVDGDRTANESDYRSFVVTNRGSDGTGTDEIASGDTSTVGISQYVPFSLVLAATPTVVNRGEVLTIASTHVGSGVAIGENILVVTFRPIRNL